MLVAQYSGICYGKDDYTPERQSLVATVCYVLMTVKKGGQQRENSSLEEIGAKLFMPVSLKINLTFSP